MLRFARFVLVMCLAVLMSKVPNAVAAEAVSQGMISTADAVDMLDRAALESKIRTHLQNDELKLELMKFGVSAEEASMRLSSLSQTELNQLATQMDEAKYGGSVVGILVIALLVVMIIYFAKRI